MAKQEKTLEQLKEELLIAQKAYDDAKRLDLKKKKAEADKKKAELAAVKEKRYQEIKDAEQKLAELRSAYVKDYGYYSNLETYDGTTAVDFMRWLFQ